MKKTIIQFLIFASIIIVGCKSQDLKFDNKQSKQLYKKQKQLTKIYSKSAKLQREFFFKKIQFKTNAQNDTIWLIERIDEVDQIVNAIIWSSKRDYIFRYGNSNSFKVNTFNYSEKNDPLVLITEKFDTIQINSKSSYLGANRVFVTQITQAGILTYFFSDITPINFFVD